MPRSTFEPKESIAKLPLAVRKEIRDRYEVQKDDLEAGVAEVLKRDNFSFNFNANEIWAYNMNDGQNAGNILVGYAESFISAIKSFVEAYGEDGINELNLVAPKPELTVKVNEMGNDAPTIVIQIQDGGFQILFHQERLGYNFSSLGREEILAAVDEVPRKGLAFQVRASIREKKNEYENVSEDIAEILNIKDIKLEPNFEENYSKLLSSGKDKWNFKPSFVAATLDYFVGLRDKFRIDNVKEDEMVQETIQESLGEKIIKLRIVDKVKNGHYNGCAFEDGVLYLETTPAHWYANTGQVGDKLIDLL